MLERNRFYNYDSCTLKEYSIKETLYNIASGFDRKSLAETEQILNEISQAIRIYLLANDDNPHLQEISDLLSAES